MSMQAKLKKVGSKFELYVGKTLHGVFGSIGAAASYLKKEFGKAFVPAPKGAKNPNTAYVNGADLERRMKANKLKRVGEKREKDGVVSFWKAASGKVYGRLVYFTGAGPYWYVHKHADQKNPWHGGTQPGRGKDYVGTKSGWNTLWKGSAIDAKALANHLTRSHNIPAKTAKAGKQTAVKIQLKNASAAKRVLQDFKSELSAQGRKNPGCKVGRRKNVAMGKTIGKGKNRRFMPFRSSPDYDPSRLHDDEGKKARARKRAKAKKSKARKAAPVRKGSKRSSMTRYRMSNPDNRHLADIAWEAGRQWILTGDAYNSGVANARQTQYGFSKWWNNQPADFHGNKKMLLKNFAEGVKSAKNKSKKSNPGKRKIPAAFKAAAERAKAMTPAQRAAWAKKMAAAKAAKRRGR